MKFSKSEKICIQIYAWVSFNLEAKCDSFVGYFFAQNVPNGLAQLTMHRRRRKHQQKENNILLIY